MYTLKLELTEKRKLLAHLFVSLHIANQKEKYPLMQTAKFHSCDTIPIHIGKM